MSEFLAESNEADEPGDTPRVLSEIEVQRFKRMGEEIVARNPYPLREDDINSDYMQHILPYSA